MLSPALAPCWLLVASASATYDASVRTEARVFSPAAPSRTAPGELDLAPALRLTVHDGDAGAQLGYTPRLILSEVGGIEPQHSAYLLGEWRPARGVRLSASEQATHGLTDLLAPDTLPGATSTALLQPLPSTPELPFVSSATTLGAETTALAPGLRVHAAATWLVSGGLGETARAEMPLQWGPQLSAGVRQALTPLDALDTSLLGSDALFSNGRSASVLQLSGQWLRRIDRGTRARLGLGAGLIRTLESPGGPAGGGVVPIAFASLSHRLPDREHPLDGELTAQVAPFVDPLAGTSYERADASLSLTWTFERRLQAYAWAGGALPLTGSAPQGTALARLALGTRWFLSPHASLAGALQGFWSPGQNASSASSLSWEASLSLAVGTGGPL